MRTTITLDPDVAELVGRLMDERAMTFKQAINETLRAGLTDPAPSFQQTSRDLGKPSLNLDKALRVAAALEEDALVAKLELRK